ncbi:MAG: SCO family protein [Chitinophagaceae bacterium]|nr:SCO family protein [Chitinophagaceae bacterium]
MYQRLSSGTKWAIAVALLFSACRQTAKQSSLPYYNAPDFTPIFASAKEADQRITHRIADFSCTDQEGRTITNKNIAGKIHVADFIFTSCGSICPTMTTQMARVGKVYERDSSVMILSYSVTPWIDTPEKLKAYRSHRSITNPNWHFLTGNKAAIYSLARTSYFAEESLGYTKDSSQFLHTEHFILVDAQQRIRGIYNGTLQLEAEQLIRDIAALKKEMSAD